MTMSANLLIELLHRDSPSVFMLSVHWSVRLSEPKLHVYTIIIITLMPIAVLVDSILVEDPVMPVLLPTACMCMYVCNLCC